MSSLPTMESAVLRSLNMEFMKSLTSIQVLDKESISGAEVLTTSLNQEGFLRR